MSRQDQPTPVTPAGIMAREAAALADHIDRRTAAMWAAAGGRRTLVADGWRRVAELEERARQLAGDDAAAWEEVARYVRVGEQVGPRPRPAPTPGPETVDKSGRSTVWCSHPDGWRRHHTAAGMRSHPRRRHPNTPHPTR